MKKTLVKLREQWQLFLLLLIPLIYLIVYCYYPMFGLQIAFKNFSLKDGIVGSKWIGFANFQRFVSSYMFERVIRNTLIISVYSIAAGFPVPIAFALLLNSMRHLKLKKLVQTTTQLPHFISTVVVVGILMQLINPLNGLYGSLYKALKNKVPDDLMSDPAAFVHLYVWSGVWQNFGWNSIIYVAALTGISEELHEAAQIDGAGRLQRLWHIDLPGIMPTVIIMLILRCGQVMTIGFEKAYIMQNDLNLRSSEIISTYEYKIAFGSSKTDFSLSTAIGMFNSVINLMIIVSVNSISRKLGETSLW